MYGLSKLHHHVAYTFKMCRFYLRDISRISNYRSHTTSVVLAKSLVMLRMDYSNDLFYGFPNVLFLGFKQFKSQLQKSTSWLRPTFVIKLRADPDMSYTCIPTLCML